jgi:serine/threonine-protein kinase
MDEPKSPLADRLAKGLAGSYALEGEIGRGGMGVVYAARDLRLKRRVAIKVLPPELAFREEIRSRFLREAETAARLSHPNIVPIHAVGEVDELVYFVMAYVDGESLAARLRRRERLPPEEARRILKETADALGLAHAMNVIHRDIKPDNILLEGTRRRVVVTDFGIAKALTEAGGGTLTGTGVVIGTPTYMSPEQAAGEREIDARSDIYSLGLVGFEMLVGDPPFQAATVPGILLKQIAEPAPDLLAMRPDCPEDLAATIMRCLEKDPADRWPTADALRRALESRVSVPYRRPVAGERPAYGQARNVPRPGGTDRGASVPSPSPPRARRAAREPSPAQESQAPAEPIQLRRFRAQFASYVSVNGGLLLLNVLTGIGDPWFLFVAIPWGIGVASQYGKLWSAGYTWRDVLRHPPARDALPPARTAASQAGPAGRLPVPDSKTEEFGPLAAQIQQMRRDRAAIGRIVAGLGPAERALLPEVQPTVDALLQRAEELARTLAQMEGSVDQASLARLEARIQALEAEPADPEQARRLDLLRRQRAMLVELLQRRAQVEARFESCVLAIQNVRFDLLRLRSAGVGSALGDLTSATQQVRALSADVEAAIGAAGEIRQVLGKGLS